MKKINKILILATATIVICACSIASFAGTTGAITRVDYKRVYFGSYPQREVVAQASQSGAYNSTWGSNSSETNSTYIVDSNLYATLQRLSDDKWDSNGDATVDGNKYRRIKKSNATYGTSGDSYLYNWSDSTTYHYFKYEPIKWQVLKTTEDDAFLLCDIAIDDQKYNTSYTSITWEKSTVRSWLNGYGSSSNKHGTNYSGKGFYDVAFSSEEKGAIKTTNVVNSNNKNYGTAGGNNTKDKIFLLSEDEVYGSNATQYGFASSYITSDTARKKKSSTYAKAMGVWSNTSSSYLGNCYWWLRSPGGDARGAAYVYGDGVSGYGSRVDINYNGILPALHINLKSINLADVTEMKLSFDRAGYTGKEIKPTVKIEGLTEGEDYTVSYSNNIEVGTATVTATAIKSSGWTGAISKTFEIAKAFPKDEFKLSKTQYEYDGQAKTPSVTAKTLTEGEDYSVRYINNVNPGTAKALIEGIGEYGETVELSFKITDTIEDKVINIETSNGERYYSGKAIEPKVTIEGLSEGTDFEVSYDDNDAVGTGKIKIDGKGGYYGTVNKTFEIKKVELSDTELAFNSLEDVKTIHVKNASNINAEITWKSSNESIIAVEKENDGSCTVIPKNSGSATVIATCGYDSIGCSVTVDMSGYPEGYICAYTTSGDERYVYNREVEFFESFERNEVQGLKYVESENTLYLDGYKGGPIYTSIEDINVVVKSASTINHGGELYTGMYLERGGSISGSGKLTIKGGLVKEDGESWYSDGIGGVHEINFNNANINISNVDYGVYSEGAISILGGNITIASKDVAVEASETIDLHGASLGSGYAVRNVNGYSVIGKSNAYCDEDDECYYNVAKNITIKGGTVLSEENEEGSWTLNIKTGKFIVDGELYYSEEEDRYNYSDYGNYIKSVEIKDGAEEVYLREFNYPNVQSISIPASVEWIEFDCYCDDDWDIGTIDHSLEYFPKLTAVNVNKNNKYYTSVSGNVYDKSMKALEFYPCGKKAKSFTLPKTVEYITPYALTHAQVTKLVLPAVFKGGGEIDGENEKYEEYNYYDSYGGTTIFSDFQYITDISVDKKNTEYKSTNGTLIRNGKELLWYSQNNKARSYKVPEGIEKIGAGVFANNKNLQSITVPDSVKACGWDPFAAINGARRDIFFEGDAIFDDNYPYSEKCCNLIYHSNNASWKNVEASEYSGKLIASDDFNNYYPSNIELSNKNNEYVIYASDKKEKSKLKLQLNSSNKDAHLESASIVSSNSSGLEVKTECTYDESGKAMITANCYGLIIGKYTVTATMPNGVTCSRTIEVRPQFEKASIDAESLEVFTNKIVGVGKNKVTWSTSNKNVATVNSSGEVSVLWEGECEIRAKVAGVTYSYPLKVDYAAPIFDKESVELSSLESYTNELSDVGNNKITWSSSDTNVATVSSGGEVTAKWEGDCEIRAKVAGKTFSYDLSVDYEEPSFKSDEVELVVGETDTNPLDIGNVKISWSTSNKKVATVDSSGKVKGVRAGECKITAKILGKSFSYWVYVEPEYPGEQAVGIVNYNKSGGYFTLKVINNGNNDFVVNTANAEARYEDDDGDEYVVGVKSSGSVTVKPGQTKTVKFTLKKKISSYYADEAEIDFYFNYCGEKYFAGAWYYGGEYYEYDSEEREWYQVGEFIDLDEEED